MSEDTLILGAGMTGLAAGLVSGLPVVEAAASPGGICSSYYRNPGTGSPEAEAESYRFEIGGGHWIFGGDPGVLDFIERLTPCRRYARRSSVYFPENGLFVPYPLQNNLRYLDGDTASQALEEMAGASDVPATMHDWLLASFGPTLTGLFFGPFHDLYTAGLFREIAPQDPYKSPVNLRMALRGAFSAAPSVGYNTTFLYPEAGLDALALRMAEHCRVDYGREVIAIDPSRREVSFADGGGRRYQRLISTLPLNHALSMSGLEAGERPDPYTSVLVLNIGARRGPRCPDDHWLYVPQSLSGFHRVGFYSNVDRSFLPASRPEETVSLYIERAFLGGEPRPAGDALRRYCDSVVQELTDWGFIGDAEIVDPTWIDVAYTWSWPGSSWRVKAIEALQEAGIFQVGRYGRWVFQGIADSVRDGFVIGGALRPIV